MMKYALQCTYKCSGFSSCVTILCMYDERGTRCKSHDTCPDIPIWLKNEVSSHSNQCSIPNPRQYTAYFNIILIVLDPPLFINLSTVFINVFTDQSQKVVFILASFDLDFNLSSTIHSSFTLFHNPDAQCLPKMLVRS